MKQAKHIYKNILFLFFYFFILACSKVELNSYKAPKTISIKVINYCPQNTYNFENFFVFNSSILMEKEEVRKDFDRDGLIDLFELDEQYITKYNISSASPDTNNDGYSDFIIYSLGIDKTNQEKLPYCLDFYQDTDKDGINDCEEYIFNTDHLKLDSDSDGIPDGLEIKRGLNPLDKNDAGIDIDHDGYNALEEIKMNTPIFWTNNETINRYATKYLSEVVYLENEPGEEEKCFNLTANNVVLDKVENGNLIKIIIIEIRSEQEQGEIKNILTAKIIAPYELKEEITEVKIFELKGQTIDATTGKEYVEGE